MSFSSRVREELSNHIPEARHCQIAEIAAIFGMCGRVIYTEKGKINTEASDTLCHVAIVCRKFLCQNVFFLFIYYNLKCGLFCLSLQGNAHHLFDNVRDLAGRQSHSVLNPCCYHALNPRGAKPCAVTQLLAKQVGLHAPHA